MIREAIRKLAGVYVVDWGRDNAITLWTARDGPRNVFTDSTTEYDGAATDQYRFTSYTREIDNAMGIVWGLSVGKENANAVVAFCHTTISRTYTSDGKRLLSIPR